MSGYAVTNNTSVINVRTVVGVGITEREFSCCCPAASVRPYAGFILGIAVTTGAGSA